MIKFLKCVPLKDETFTITLQGDKDTDEISFIRLRGKAVKVVEEQESLTDSKTELLRSIRDSMSHIEKMLEEEKHE